MNRQLLVGEGICGKDSGVKSEGIMTVSSNIVEESMPCKKNNGDDVEINLFEILKKQFGADCVYHSVKYKKKNGQEKELSDLLIVALPYVISIQLKWLSYNSDDFESGRGHVIAQRVIKRMEDGARQHKSLTSLLSNASSIELPAIWDEGKYTYHLPTTFIKKVLPIVVIDFDDKRYDDPDNRLLLPPIVASANNNASDISVVHAFLLKDMKRILEDMFTVGDFLTYLHHRARILEKRNQFHFPFNELTLFAIYLTKFDLFEKLMRFDHVLFLENDIYERRMFEVEDAIKKRRRLYSENDRVDDIMQFLKADVRSSNKVWGSIENCAVQYIVCLSRLKIFGSMFKRMISDRIEYCWTRVVEKNEQSHLSYIVDDEKTITGLSIIVACIDINSDEFVKNTVGILDWAFRRFMTALKNEKVRNDIEEVLIILFDRSKEKICMCVRELVSDDYKLALSESEAEEQSRLMKIGNYHFEEWGFLKSKT